MNKKKKSKIGKKYKIKKIQKVINKIVQKKSVSCAATKSRGHGGREGGTEGSQGKMSRSTYFFLGGEGSELDPQPPPLPPSQTVKRDIFP